MRPANLPENYHTLSSNQRITMKLKDFVKFDVTGIDKNSKRFKLTYPGTANGYATANCINIYKGTMWGVLPSGKRILLKTVVN